MQIFVSYAREDRVAVGRLVEDLTQAEHTVWMDRSLRGGQLWWTTILDEIERCAAYVFVLSPASAASSACRAEAEWATALGRPTLLVELADTVDGGPVPGAARRVDLRERTVDSVIGLITTLAALPLPPALPDPMPVRPGIPVSYLSSLGQRVAAVELGPDEQAAMIAEIEGALADVDERDAGREILRRLAARDDLTSETRAALRRLGTRHGRVEPAVAGRLHPSAVPIVILALISPFVLGVPGLLGLFMVNRALHEVSNQPDRYRGRNLLLGLRVLCILGVAAVVPFTWWMIR